MTNELWESYVLSYRGFFWNNREEDRQFSTMDQEAITYRKKEGFNCFIRSLHEQSHAPHRGLSIVGTGVRHLLELISREIEGVHGVFRHLVAEEVQ